MSTTYKATATREGQWWVIDVDGVGVTQERTLRDAPDQARDLVATMLDVAPETVEIDLHVDLDGFEVEVAAARRESAEAAAAQQRAARRAREVATSLRERGLSVTDTAVVLGVSRGRVSQLVG
ncbi:antitoxin HicB [Xylanimonas oleitrophica]|uniref:Antitoxin HicB n=1 Tax=Xylanimonas oleitrophica TaxID=2607479 RepID=A0A2W5X2T9_9MICO|nr:antitoxin HicB [Xylanimonas oleitrophica]PZR55236.1 antitoxin HicB [Xylanimonas oleitrophica]